MQVETLDTTVIDYIKEIRTNLELQMKEMQANYEHQIHKLRNNVIEYENKYLEIKERYDLLIYRRFMRSAERIPFDDKQQLLFTPALVSCVCFNFCFFFGCYLNRVCFRGKQ